MSGLYGILQGYIGVVLKRVGVRWTIYGYIEVWYRNIMGDLCSGKEGDRLCQKQVSVSSAEVASFGCTQV